MRPRFIAAIAVVGASTAMLGCSSDDVPQSEGTTATAPPSTANSEGVEPAATSVAEPDFGDVADNPEGAGEATGPLGSTEIRIDTDAGTVQIGSGVVPERLDPEFPLPADLLVELASETATDLGFSGTSELSFDELVELYESGLPAAGYAIVSFDRRGDDFAVFEFTNDVGIGQVAISDAPGPAAYTVIVAFGDGDGEETQLGN